MMVEFGCLRVPVERCRFFTVTQPCKTVKSVGARVLMSLATASHENVFNASIELSRRREPEKEKYIQVVGVHMYTYIQVHVATLMVMGEFYQQLQLHVKTWPYVYTCTCR